MHPARPVILFCVCTLHIANTERIRPEREDILPDYRRYHNFTMIENEIRSIYSSHRKFMKINWSYRSRKNRPQYLLRISNFTSQENATWEDTSVPRGRSRVLLTFGVHARELFPVESLFYLLRQLQQGMNSATSKQGYLARKILSNVDLFIIALANPDGRHLLEKRSHYCWRGTSTGVDLNRNFDWNFGGSGSSDMPGDSTYHGKAPFSEPETRVFTEITLQYKFDAFVSFHSGTKAVYLPYADSKSRQTDRLPENYQQMNHLSQLMARSVQPHFEHGMARILRDAPSDGTSLDYMSGIRKIPFSLVVELFGDRPSLPGCFRYFNPTNENLELALRHVFPIYETFFTHLIQWKETGYIQEEGRPWVEIVVLCVIVLCVVTGLATTLVCFRRRILSNCRWPNGHSAVQYTAVPVNV